MSLVQVEGMLAIALADMETGYARPGSDVRPLLPVKTTVHHYVMLMVSHTS